MVAPLRAQSASAQVSTARQANEGALKAALFQMRDAIDRYYLKNKRYPRSLAVLVTERYLERIPADPFTNSTHSWRTRKAAAAAGIYDVKSGSPATAMDGTKYSHW
jgi:general secretion pathway protein G